MIHFVIGNRLRTNGIKCVAVVSAKFEELLVDMTATNSIPICIQQ